ncbi:MAG: hypothetical protein WC997_06685 [Porticoccaceae bacterium]
MAVTKPETEQTITIDGNSYVIADLSDTAKSQLANIRYVEREIEETKNKMAVLQAARQYYAGILGKELPSK